MNAQEKLKTDPVFLYKTLGKEWVTRNQKLLMQPYSKIFRGFFTRNGLEMGFRHLLRYRKPLADFLESLDGQRLRYYLWLLDSALLEVDEDIIGPVVNALKKEGVYDKTIIIVMADHGTEYREHGHIEHGQFLYDEELRILMIFHVPGESPGVKINSLVESVDLLPTVCDLLGIPVPSQAQGVSLRKLWERGFEGEGKRYVISQSIGSDYLAAIRSSRWKLIMEAKKGLKPKELYNMEKDPGELQNVIASNPEAVKELRGAYISKINSLPSYQSKMSEFFPGIDEETRKRIQETGYW